MKVIIAGATGDIGRAIAKSLGQDNHELLLLYRSQDKKEGLRQVLNGMKVHFYCIQNLFERSEEIQTCFYEFSPEVFINAIGDGFYAKVEDASLVQIDASYEANFKVPFFLTQMAYRVFKAQGRGHIILINSVSGLEGFPYGIAYCPFKFALRGMAEVMYKEGKRYKIKVSTIYPGIVKTKLLSKMPFKPKEKGLLTPEEIARTTKFLLHLSKESEVKELVLKNAMLTWR